MFADGLLCRHPFIRTAFVPSHYPAVAHRIAEKLGKESRAQAALTNLAPEDGAIFFLTEGLRVMHVHEMAQLVNLSMPVASLTELHEENDRQIDIPVESEEEEIQNKLALYEVLKILPENDRRLIELRYYKGLTQTKTAEILGLSQVQVSRRERTILLELRRKLTG